MSDPAFPVSSGRRELRQASSTPWIRLLMSQPSGRRTAIVSPDATAVRLLAPLSTFPLPRTQPRTELIRSCVTRRT